MPKLNQETAKKVNAAETQDFSALPEGPYVASLKEVTAKDGQKGTYWSWEYEVVEPEEFVGRKLWNNTSLSEAAHFKLKESFDAFGVKPNTDTDELIGQVVTLQVEQQVIGGGARKGQVGNQVASVLPYGGGSDGGGDFDEEDF